jgi:hypothetical protein
VSISDETTDWRLTIVFRAGRRRPTYDDTITGDVSGATFDLTEGVVGAAYKFEDFNTTHGAYLTALSANATALRSRIGAVPGGGTIAGLHYHEDQLYSIRDVAQITVSPAEANTLKPGMYVVNATGEIGEVLATSADGETVNIAPTARGGFTVVPTDTLSIALSIRYNTASGEFNPGDLVLGATSAWAGTLGHYENRDGSFSAGNALGVAVCVAPTNNPAVTVGEIFNNVTATGALTVESIMFAYQQDVATVLTTASQSDLATMWRSTDDGWERATSGRSLRFYDGVLDPVGAPVPATSTSYATDVGWYANGGYSSVNWNGTFSDVEGPEDGTTIDALCFVDTFGTIWETDYAYAKGFDIALLDSDTVTGLTVTMYARGTGDLDASVVKFTNLLGGGSSVVAQCSYVGGIQPTSAGGINDTWGATLTPAIVNSPNYGVTFQGFHNTLAGGYVYIDAIELTVHYTSPPGEKLYLYNAGQDIGYIKLASVVLESGTWVGGDATGYFRAVDWTVVSVPRGTEIRTLPAGGGSLIALVDSDLSVPALPGSALLDENKSKYQMISYNFFASEEKNAIYGCSGAGMAFWYDGTVLDFIPTGVDVALDKPRHLSEHQQRLCLGYIWGEVYVSDANGPTSFSGQHFAASYGFGDKITGLEPASGDALAVFTESATHVLVGNNGGDTAVRQDVINHKVGAIEYTVQNMGNRPIFTSFRGIETLETMDQYSNFFTAPLTYDVSPWLLRRLQVATGALTTSEAVVNSVVVRNKNQYRLFFADGWVLTLTYVGKEKDAQNTTQQYWFNSDRAQYARCYATAQGVTSDGRDRAFFSVESRPGSPEIGASTATPEIEYAYVLDQGFSFDGGAIDSEFHLTHNFGAARQGGPNPSYEKGYQHINFHGYSSGYADLHVSRSLNNEDLDVPVQGYEPAPFGSLAEPAERELKAKYTQARLSARGFAVSVHVAHSSAVEFPHVVQMITFTDDKQLRMKR